MPPEETQPCFRLHPGHQKLFKKLISIQHWQSWPHRGAFSYDGTREGCHGKSYLGMQLGRVVAMWSRTTSWGTLGSHAPGGPGSCPHVEGAECLDPMSSNSSDCPHRQSPERHILPSELPSTYHDPIAGQKGPQITAQRLRDMDPGKSFLF